MAVNPTPDASRGMWSAVKGALGLFDPLNKSDGITEANNPQPIDEYESSMDEKEIIELVSQWKRTYSVYYTEVEKSQKLAFDYWIGRHRNEDARDVSKDFAGQVDNLIFEAVETFLPIATRANPSPIVTSDPSDLGQKLSKNISTALVHEADKQKLRRELARVTRKWTLDRLGSLKVSWNVPTSALETTVVSTRKMLFDKDGFIDEGGRFRGEYLGEKKQATAEKLKQMFPKKSAYITEKAKGKMGTRLDYIEWWYRDTDVFYTLEDEVLGKYKNPNWNWDGEIEVPNQETGEVEKQWIQGKNHFKEPQAPYIFLSVFSTGQQPHDDTGLIIQNIPIQDRINRRFAQIEKNVQGMNDGLVVGPSFTQEQASQAASALRRGVAIRVPSGDVRAAVQRFNPGEISSSVFKALEDDRNELRNIFGTSGSTPQGTEQQKTVRGKILVNQMDSSRIGGGVTECIEQVADSWFNWMVQMMFVYYDDAHFYMADGAEGGAELVAIKNSDMALLNTLAVTVKEGSMVPKDPLTQRNEAVDLWSASAIDPLNFYKKLDFPDPVQATQQLILWQMFQKGLIPPQAYLPSFQVGGQPEGVSGQPQAPMPGQQDTKFNPINGPDIGVQGAPPQSPPAVQAQSQALLGAVPLK